MQGTWLLPSLQPVEGVHASQACECTASEVVDHSRLTLYLQSPAGQARAPLQALDNNQLQSTGQGTAVSDFTVGATEKPDNALELLTPSALLAEFAVPASNLPPLQSITPIHAMSSPPVLASWHKPP